MSENLCDEDGKYLSLWRGEVKVRPTFLLRTEIKKMVAAKHGLTVADLELPNDAPGARRRRLAYARQEAMWEMRQVKFQNGEHRNSLPQIGQSLGGRDHSTADHGIRAHQRRLDASCEQTENV